MVIIPLKLLLMQLSMDYDDYNPIGIIHTLTQTHWYNPLLVLSLAKWIIGIPMKKGFIPMSNMIVILLSYYAIILLSHFRKDTVDGRNPTPVDRWFIPLFIGFQPSKVVQDFFHQQ